MSEDNGGREAPTRRDCMKYGGAIVGGGLLAGCAGLTDSGSTPEATNTEAPTETATETTTSTATDIETTTSTATPEDESYSVTMAPVGEVTFETVPETWISYQYAYGDMGIALNQAEGYLGTNKPKNYPDFFYDQLPGIKFDASTLTDIGSGDQEVFYELDPDVIFVDPNNARARFKWSQSEVETLETEVGPFFGHFGRRYGYSIQQGYPKLGLYDIFEKVAAVFQERERYERIKAIHDDVMETVTANLPPEDERPTIGLLSGGSNVADGRLFLMEATAPGYGRKQYRDLGVNDVMDAVETDEQFYETDFEELLELDPDELVVHWTVQLSDEEFRSKFVKPIKDDPVGSELTAVQNDQIHQGGTAEQGPIINLFQTELGAEQFYPEIIQGRDLFSREELASIVTDAG